MTSYMVRCDDCKKTIKMTEDIKESYAGGWCSDCKTTHLNRHKFKVINSQMVCLYHGPNCKTKLPYFDGSK